VGYINCFRCKVSPRELNSIGKDNVRSSNPNLHKKKKSVFGAVDAHRSCDSQQIIHN